MGRAGARPGRETDEAIETSERERFCGVYERWHPPIEAYCRRRLNDFAVDDAVAETFIVAWRRIDEVPPGREALLWLYRVAYRVVGHAWRSDGRRRRLGERLESEPNMPSTAPDDVVVADDEVRRIGAALDLLKPSDAEILRLAGWEGLTPHDLSQVLDVRPNTASQRLARARKHLARRVDALDRDPVRSPVARKGGSR